MNNKLIIGSKCGGIGDNLIFTPIFKVFRNATIELLEHPKSHIVAPIFDNLCEVRFVKEPTQCPESFHPHVAQKKLEGLNIDKLVNCIPLIYLKKEELIWAQDYLRQYSSNITQFVAFSTDNNGSKNPQDTHAHYRLMTQEQAQKVIDFYAKRFTVLQFAMTNNYTKLNNCVPLLDLTIREMAACFTIIKKYVGIDTGHYHLMLAVGGVARVFVPSSSYFYNHKEWHYTQELWKTGRPESCRVEYINFSKINEYTASV